MGGYSDTYSDLYDPAFPQSVLDTRTELQLNGVWTDVSAFVYERDKVTITYGHPDETQAANPTKAALTLNNRDGRFSPRNPVGAYFGSIGRNTPMRQSLPQGSVYLRMEQDTVSYASCPSTGSLNVTGDFDVRMDMAPSNYSANIVALATKGARFVNQLSWLLQLNPDGTLGFWWSTDGTTGGLNQVFSSIAIPLGRIAVRATLTAATGTVTFYTAPTISGSWTQLGTAASGTSGAATSIFASTAPPTIGSNIGNIGGVVVNFNGSVFGLQMLNGIGGTPVASPDFTAQVPGTAPFTDAQGNVWSVSGTAELSDRRYRAHTEVPAWPPRWDPTGTDVYAPIEGSGLLRRYTQGTPPKLSSMYRGYSLLAGAAIPQAYWPCEDGSNSGSIASALSGGSPMIFSGTPTFAGNSNFPCSLPIPTVNSSAWSGPVYTWPSSASANVCRFLMQVPAAGDTNNAVIARMYTSGTVARLDLLYNTGGALTLTGYSAGGTQLFTSLTGFNVNGALMRVSMELTTSGSNINWVVGTLVAGSNTYFFNNGTLTSATLGAVSSVGINPGSNLTGTAIGHISIQAISTSVFGTLFGPLRAWINETAGARFARLCSEQGVNSRVYGFPNNTVAMGYQEPNDFVSLLQECESADGGLMYEPKQTLGLAYRTRVSMFNQAAKLALSYTAAQLSPPIEPTDDDLLIRNDYTVTRNNASSARAYLATGPLSINPPPNGVGDYGQAVTLSLASDSQLPDEAGWLVHMGTVDDVRYPALSVDLSRTELASVYYQAQDVAVGDRVTVASTPGWLPPDGISQVVRGGVEVCYGYIHTEQWNCAPESPYRVATCDDPVLGVADTDGSTLAGGPTYSATATSLQVATTGAATGSPLWTTSAGDWPFDIEVAGERMTVTAVAGTSSPQTFTVTRSVNGVVKSQTAGTDVRLFQPAILSM